MRDQWSSVIISLLHAIILSDSEKGNLNTCYMCVEVMWRTPNILKYRKGIYFSINEYCVIVTFVLNMNFIKKKNILNYYKHISF